MLTTRVIPCLLLRNQGLVKTVKFKEPKYVGDPINAVRIFNEKEVDELVFLDITATVDGRGPNYQVLENIAGEAFMPLSYGGGIRSVEDAKRVFNLGFEKIVINSSAAESPDLVSLLADTFGSQSVVVSIDARKSFFGKQQVYVRSGTKKIDMEPAEFAVEMGRRGAGEIFLNSIDRDGTMTGFDLDLVKDVSTRVEVPLIACGGAGKLDDFSAAIAAGASAVAAGSMFVFHGKHRAVLITYPSPEELKATLGEQQA
jgi:cyclase